MVNWKINLENQVENVGFPDPLAPDSEKQTPAFGLQVARAIQHEWFHKNEGQDNARFQIQKNDFHLRRLYARGEHPTDYINQTLNEGDDEAYTNFDLRPIQVLPRFVKILSNHASQRLFKLRAQATDKFSTEQRDKQRMRLENLMVSAPMLQQAEQMHGVSLVGQDEHIPQSEEEVDVQMMDYKTGIEVATEKAIKYTMNRNRYEETQMINIEDLITCGVAGVVHETDPDKGIMIRSADPADMVWAFPENRTFDNVYYYGEVRRQTVTEVMRKSGMKLSKKQLQSLAKSHDRWATHMGYSNTRTNRDEDMPHMMVDVLYFTFKAYNTASYKKKYKPGNRYSMIEKDENLKKKDPNYKGYDVVKKTYDVWYKGALVLGTDMLFNWGLCENMVRPEGILSESMPPYIMYGLDVYQGRFRSPVFGCMAYIDQMQQVHVKIQQMIAKARPAGVSIDVHGLDEVFMNGKGGEPLTPLELQKIYDQTGNVYYSSLNDDGSMNYNREPIRELNNGVIKGLPELIAAYNHYLELIRGSLGVPQGMDATLPDERTLVGVQKLAAASSGTATKHILQGGLDISQRAGTAIALRLKDIFKYSHLKEAYIQAIGREDVKTLRELKKYHLHDLSVFIELLPDVEEKMELNESLNIALEAGQITIADRAEIKSIDNIKQATQVLKIRIKKNEELKAKREQEMVKVNAEENGKAAERASKAKIEEIMAKEAAARETLTHKTNQRLRELEFEKQMEMELMDRKFRQQVIGDGFRIEAQGTVDVEKEKVKAASKPAPKSENNITGSIGDGRIAG